MTQKGRFKPKFPKKYKGDPTNIIYRSSWELRVMKYLDTNENVLEWSSEEIAIPYKCPTDNRRHRYFPDFYVVARTMEGTTKTMLWEVKPAKETKEPKRRKKITRQYVTEVMTWGKNQAKWEACRSYCLDRGWEFRLLTEAELGIK